MQEKDQINCFGTGLFLDEFKEKHSQFQIRELQRGLGVQYSYSQSCNEHFQYFKEAEDVNSILININKEIPSEYSPFGEPTEKTFLNILIFVEIEYFNGFSDDDLKKNNKRDFAEIFGDPEFLVKMRGLSSILIQKLEVNLFSSQLPDFLFEAWIYQYLYEISNATFEAYSPRAAFIYKQDDIEKIQNLESTIKNTRINSMPSITEMAEGVGMSPTKFKKIFKEVFGQSTHQYILDIKIKQALVLLKTHSLSVSQVAYKLGFSNPSGLARLLKNSPKI